MPRGCGSPTRIGSVHLALVNPPFTFPDRESVTPSQCLGLLYIAAYVRARGHTVTVVDALGEAVRQVEPAEEGGVRAGLSLRAIAARIPAHTDLIGVAAPFSHLAPTVHALIGEIRSTHGSTPVVLGGAYPSTQPGLAAASGADYLVLGEGETPTAGLMELIRRHGNGPVPPGVTAVAAPGNAAPACAPPVTDLDALPVPARDLVPFDRYVRRSQRNLRGWRTASIITSRGCPFDCEFCSVHPVVGYRWRPRSAQRVLAEIDALTETYGIDHFEIEDDNFTLERERALAVLEGIRTRRERTGRPTWSALNGLRIDTLDAEMIDVVKRSGCRHLCLALEHGDAAVLVSLH
jgi:magnesium-protoporphyrin IX monomethyl ester (oxidative) cyclase